MDRVPHDGGHGALPVTREDLEQRAGVSMPDVHVPVCGMIECTCGEVVDWMSRGLERGRMTEFTATGNNLEEARQTDSRGLVETTRWGIGVAMCDERLVGQSAIVSIQRTKG